MKYTENFNLKKPLQTEYYDVDDFNDNMDIVDREINGRVALTGGTMTGRLSFGTSGGSPETGIYESNGDLVLEADGVVDIYELYVKYLSVLKNGILNNAMEIFESNRGTVTVAAYDCPGVFKQCADYVSENERGDYTAIKNAISSARDGMTVELLPGNYNIYGNGIFEIEKKITVRGGMYGSAVKIYQLKDEFDEPATMFRLLNEVTVENLCFEMCDDSQSPKSITVIENGNCIVRNCIFKTSGIDGGTPPTPIVIGTRGGQGHSRRGIRIEKNCFDTVHSKPCVSDEFGGVDIGLRESNNDIGAFICGNFKTAGGSIRINSDCGGSRIIAYGNGELVKGAYTEEGQEEFGGEKVYTIGFL